MRSRFVGTCEYREDVLSVAIIMTGGTIAKTYNPETAVLENTHPIVEHIIAGLHLQDLAIEFVDLMHLDSLDMTDRHRRELAATTNELVDRKDAIIITHGTDTLVQTENDVATHLPTPRIPVVFTGAMVPFVIQQSDASQNLTESLLALRFLPPGNFVVFHNRVLELPNVVKNHNQLTFTSTHQT